MGDKSPKAKDKKKAQSSADKSQKKSAARDKQATTPAAPAKKGK